MPHFTGKARVWDYVQSLGFPVCTSLEAGYGTCTIPLVYVVWGNLAVCHLAAMHTEYCILCRSYFSNVQNFPDIVGFVRQPDGSVQMTATMLGLHHKLPGYDPSSTGELT